MAARRVSGDEVAASPGLEALLRRGEILREIEGDLGPERAAKARGDPHARRRPRPCGLTVHPGIGCPHGCLYCYVGDLLGGPSEPRPTQLSGLEMAYALATNPYFVPGIMGTFLALGAICDPFYPSLVGRTLGIISAVQTRLGNPIQFSTKIRLTADLVAELPRGGPISPLITIVSLERANELEPRAPPPEERLESISELRRAGFKPFLFLRPLIPGLIERELDDILSEAKAAGAVGVVVGSLRVSRLILARLGKIGLDKPVLARLKRRPPLRKLVPVPSADLKQMALEAAEERGLIGLRAACCANALVAGVPCADLCWLRGFCTSCPNRCIEKLPPVDEELLSEALSLFGLKAKEISVGEHRISIRLGPNVDRPKLAVARVPLEVATRRQISFIIGRR